MSWDQPQTTQRLAGPRHLLGGRARRRLEQVQVVAAWSPLLAVAALAVVAAGLGPLGPIGVTVLACASAGLPIVREWARWAWWRSRWYYDARAAGLAVEAEPGVLARTDGVLDRRVVVVPTVSVTVLAHGARRYRCRPLPGQIAADYAAAVARLLVRWGAVSIVVKTQPGDRHITLVVHPTAPPTTTYRRGAL